MASAKANEQAKPVRPSAIWAMIRGRCPRCRKAKIFSGVFAMNEVCPVCGHTLRDNLLPHADRCDTCVRYRPPPVPYRVPPEADRRDLRPTIHEANTDWRLPYAA